MILLRSTVTVRCCCTVDPDAKQLSSNSLSDKSYVVHCVGVEKEADLVPVFAVSFCLLAHIIYVTIITVVFYLCFLLVSTADKEFLLEGLYCLKTTNCRHGRLYYIHFTVKHKLHFDLSWIGCGLFECHKSNKWSLPLYCPVFSVLLFSLCLCFTAIMLKWIKISVGTEWYLLSAKVGRVVKSFQINPKDIWEAWCLSLAVCRNWVRCYQQFCCTFTWLVLIYRHWSTDKCQHHVPLLQ